MQFSLKTALLAKWRYIVGALVVLVLGWYFFGGGQGSGVGATLIVSQGDFQEQVSISGTVIAAQNVALGFASSGRIAGTYVRVGQYVGAGTVLAETENGDLVAMLEQKRSALTEAQANLASLHSGTRPEEVAVAQTAVANAQAALVNAIQNAYTVSDDAVHNKVDALFTNARTNPKLSFTVGSASLQTIVERDRAATEPVLASWAVLITKLSNDTASASAKQAQIYLAQVSALLVDANAALNQGIPDQSTSAATLSTYATSLSTARTNVSTAATTLTTNAATFDTAQNTLTLKQAGATSDSIVAQEASVAAAAADVRTAQANLAKTRVVAPFDGTVTRMDAKVGEIVSPTTSEIGMQSNGVFELETYVPEVTIAGVMVGNSATTTLDAYGSSVTFPSKVVAVDPAETLKDGVPTYKTTLAFLTVDPRIRSGMTANVVITTGTLHDAIVIPSGAVGNKSGERYVSVLEQGKVVARTVTTGASPALGQAHILSGLSAGDVILLTPQ